MFKWIGRLLRPLPHEHTFAAMASFDGAPVPGGHTTFLVFVCACGAYHLFPKFNYDLTTKEFKQKDFPEWLSRNQLGPVPVATLDP